MMDIINAVITLLTVDGKQVFNKQLMDDPEMMNWVALQYAEVNSAQVTIRDENGKVLAFTGSEPV